MNQYLLILTIGPVQDFIVQARRTRDLWFGSHVLSEISRAAARSMVEKCTLIFPALDREDLAPCDEVRRAQGDMPPSVANKIVALVDASNSDQVRAVALSARAAAVDRLRDWGMREFKSHRTLVDISLEKLACRQLESLLQIRAAWTAIEKHGSYAEARRAVETDIARKKTLAAFSPLPARPDGGFKSSLDGVRDSVLVRPGQRTGAAWSEYNIGLREELDAVGLLKRTGGRTDQFVPVPTVGLFSWLERAQREAPHQLQAVAVACNKAREELQAQYKGDKLYAFRSLSARQPCAAAFPYDAQIMLAERWQPYFVDAWQPMSPDQRRETAARAARFGTTVQVLHRVVGEPFPYVACLVADGDRMGEAIEDCEAPEQHRKLSRALAEFAREACTIVEQGHKGILIYAGGDDVLAFVDLQHAFSCAAALRASFTRHLAPVVGEATRPTLSVGLGVGHVIESLGHLWELGRQAEKLAKNTRPCDRLLGQRNRDGVAVVWEKHAGTRHEWRARGDEAAGLLQTSVALFDDRLSAGKVHEIGALLRRLYGAGPAPGASDDDRDSTGSRVLTGEFARILSRSRAGGATDAPFDPRKQGMGMDWDKLDTEPHTTQRARVEEWLARMLIAIELHRAHQGAAIDWPAEKNS